MIRSKSVEDRLRDGRLDAKTRDSLFRRRIEQGADLVMFLVPGWYDYSNGKWVENQNDEIRTLSVLKNRNGPTGNVELTWIADRTRFTDR